MVWTAGSSPQGHAPNQINPSCLVSASFQLILSVLTDHWDPSMPPSQISPNYSIHFPPTFRKFLPKPPCPAPASGLPFSRAGGCMGLSRPNAWLSPTTVTPLLLAHPLVDLSGLLPIASLCGALPASQTAKQAHTLLPWKSLPCNPCRPNHVSRLAVCPCLGPGHCSSGFSPWLCGSKPYVLGWEWPPAGLRTWDLAVGLLMCLSIYQPSLHTGLRWFLETSYV